MIAGLRNRALTAYLFVSGAAFASAWMQRMAVGWFVWDLTHSGFWLGVLAVCDLGPSILFGPIGGILADRISPHRLIVICQIVTLAAVVALGIATAFAPSLALCLGLSLIAASAIAGQDAARSILVQTIVEPGEVPGAVAKLSVAINVARFAGPALGGIIATTAGLVWVFFAAAVSGFPLILFALRARDVPVAASESANWLKALAEALTEVWRSPLLRPILASFVVVSFLARAAYELLPSVADGIFGRGVAGLSAMTAAVGIGAVIAGLVLTRPSDTARTARFSFASNVLGGLAVIALATIPVFEAALVAAAIVGFCLSGGAITAQVVMQVEAPPAMRARVVSLWAVSIRAMPALGALMLGSAADRFGIRESLIAGGASALLFAVLIWRRGIVRQRRLSR
jgi:predicted MFS family arabinose efflux permease